MSDSAEETVGEQRATFNLRALSVVPNPDTFLRQDVRYCIRKRREEPERHPPVYLHPTDPTVVV